MANKKILVIFVHGWSVTNTDTYGGLPRRLSADGSRHGLNIQTEEIHLGKYISFNDEVEVKDIARAFDAAVKQKLIPLLKDNRRFVCITHSTGGPVIREWWHSYYINSKGGGVCPMSHLVMLAPANFGSALAQLGKGRISRMKFWLGGTEPGQRVLDWLELGSESAWNLNTDWIIQSEKLLSARGIFPFVLTGQTIDRSFYDNLNSYTGETGSDGVVRAAAANLSTQYICLTQKPPTNETIKKHGLSTELEIKEYSESPLVAFKILTGKSHSGSTLGIMRSVRKSGNDPKSEETVNSILEAINVSSKQDYDKLCQRWSETTKETQKSDKIEYENKILKDRYFIRDRFSMVIFKVKDEAGQAIEDFSLSLTVGPNDDPNKLPEGFLKDRQSNSKTHGTITYYFNYDVLRGSEEVCHKHIDKKSKKERTKKLREKLAGIDSLGLEVIAEPRKGFVHFIPCKILASKDLLVKVLKPNATTMIEIILRRVVHSNVFELESIGKSENSDFSGSKPSNSIVP